MKASETLPEAKMVASRTVAGVLSSPSEADPSNAEGWYLADNAANSRARNSATPWWLYWNILSMDAPTVAVIWALLFARACGMRLGVTDGIVLGLSVFLVYVGDRLLDGLTASNRSSLHDRHVFCARHRTALLVIVAFSAITVLWIAAQKLPIAESKAGLKLATLVAAYIVSIHASHEEIGRWLPKELAVGILFAAGTTLPAWSQLKKIDGAIWLLLILFASLCSLNCVAIDFWEHDPGATPTLNERDLTLRRHVSTEIIVSGTCAALVLLAVASSWIERIHSGYVAELSAIAFGSFLLLCLNQHRHRLARPALRVLADAVLVAAGLFGLLLRS